MLDVTPYEPIPESLPEPVETPRNLVTIAASLISGTILVGFVSLIGFYLSQRAGVVGAGEAWLPQGVEIPLTQPNYMGVTMVLSLLTVWWGVSAVRNNDSRNANLSYALTLLFGFAHIVQTIYLLTTMEMAAAGDERAILIYAVIGLQLAIVGVAMASVMVVGLRTLSGDFSSTNYEGVLGSAIFWTTAVVLYFILWYAVYIIK